MKKLLILTLALAPALACAQIPERYAERTARIETIGEGSAAGVMDRLPAGDIDRKVNGYRVEIFSDNTPAARRLAYEAYARFRELCPEVPVDERRDIRYDSPKYTVRVGRFLTYEEALILCGRIKSAFKAYPRSEQFPLSVFAGGREE